LTPTVSKTSAGALELMEINCVSDPVNFFSNLNRDQWKIISTGIITGKSKSKNKPLNKIELDSNVYIEKGAYY
jgi:tRNA G18 (ribose-2'-O)-methylase SpoU